MPFDLVPAAAILRAWVGINSDAPGTMVDAMRAFRKRIYVYAKVKWACSLARFENFRMLYGIQIGELYTWRTRDHAAGICIFFFNSSIAGICFHSEDFIEAADSQDFFERRFIAEWCSEYRQWNDSNYVYFSSYGFTLHARHDLFHLNPEHYVQEPKLSSWLRKSLFSSSLKRNSIFSSRSALLIFQ